MGTEQPHTHYDDIYASDAGRTKYTCPWHESIYAPAWRWVMDHMKTPAHTPRRVLDVGCGTGQLASAVVGRFTTHICPGVRLTSYLGVDFSPVAVALARRACPLARARFVAADVFGQTGSALLEEGQYDTVLMCEFLEHIERDLEVLAMLRPGVRLVATVPTFDSAGHVRHFEGVEGVMGRYGGLVEIDAIEAIDLASGGGRRPRLIAFAGTVRAIGEGHKG